MSSVPASVFAKLYEFNDSPEGIVKKNDTRTRGVLGFELVAEGHAVAAALCVAKFEICEDGDNMAVAVADDDDPKTVKGERREKTKNNVHEGMVDDEECCFLVPIHNA
jgi:hypothetical protein